MLVGDPGEGGLGGKGGVAIYENLGFPVSKPGVSQSQRFAKQFRKAPKRIEGQIGAETSKSRTPAPRLNPRASPVYQPLNWLLLIWVPMVFILL